MARNRIATGLEKLMSDLPRLMLQRNLAESAQMKQLSIQATEGYLKEAANFTTVAQFDSTAASMMDELGQHGNDPTIAMAGNNAFKALGRLKENFINKQEGVVALNSGFAKAKELNQLDTTSGMQDVYNAAATTLEATKQYFNSTEYSGYQKQIENLGEMIKVKSLTNYLDDLAVGETDEFGQIIVKPGIQSANQKLAMVNELTKVGMLNPKESMKQLIDISEDINAGTMGAVMNSGGKAMKALDRELAAFNMDGLDSKYTDKLLINFKTPLFTEGELTPETIGFVRDNLKATIENVIGGTGYLTDDFLQGAIQGQGIDGLEAYINKMKGLDPNQSTADIIEKVVDEYGVDVFGKDTKGDKQKEHFARMLNLYMKSNDMLDEFISIRNNKTVDSSIGAYTNALVNFNTKNPVNTTTVEPKTEPKRVKVSTTPSPFIPSTSQAPVGVLAPPPPAAVIGGTPAGKQSKGFKDVMSGKQNVLDLVKTISNQQKSIPSSPPPVSKPKPLPSLGKALAQNKSPKAIAKRAEAERIADIRVSVTAQEPDQDDMSYIENIDSEKLRRIGIWSDKNVTRKLKTEAKKELNTRIKELQSMRGDSDAAMVAEQMPKLVKLLKQFNNAGVNKISKDMLEYMYMLNASQYDGVDDFILSLSDGKIGVE